MVYEYEGFLRTLLKPGPPAERDGVEGVEFSADDLLHWNLTDLAGFHEWQKIPAHRIRAKQGVELSGDFQDVRRMDCVAPDTPSFWVALSSLGVQDPRFPVDIERFPIAEITYRCASQNAVPGWVWVYPGGLHVDMLTPSQSRRTVARLAGYDGFPQRVDALVLRLYSTARAAESIEFERVRFRAPTPAESEALRGALARLDAEAAPKLCPALDEFLPLGVYLDAELTRRMAEMLGVSFSEYWQLALEDIVRHHHNCVALENADRLTRGEWQELLAVADQFHVRLVPLLNVPLGDDPQQQREAVEECVSPFAGTRGIFAWGLTSAPRERDLPALLDVRRWVEELAPEHPFTVVTDHPSEFPLFARYFSAMGISHHVSHSPWDTAEMMRHHLPLSRGRQVWFSAPGFVWGTGAPEWSSCPELRLILNSAFANGARGFFTYSYHNIPIWMDGCCQRTLTGPFLMFSDLWQELDRQFEFINAVAPLLLCARPEPIPEGSYTMSLRSEEKAELAEGIPLTSVTRLMGDGFSVIFIVSNDIRGMASINFSINPDFVREFEIYDLSDFVQTRKWLQMPLERHLEMFPGQAHAFLIAPPARCAHWRDIVSRRLMDDDRLQLSLDMRLAREYSIDVSSLEHFLEGPPGTGGLDDLSQMDWARDRLLDLIYDDREISDARSRIIEASAALCACDGALCRLHGLGRTDLAREIGLRIVPLAREIANLRLELRRGHAKAVLQHSDDLSQRALALLSEIRTLV